MKKYSIDSKEMGRVLKRLRGEKSIDRVAADLEISPSALRMYEDGERIPRDQIKVRICNYYDKSPISIFFVKEVHVS